MAYNAQEIYCSISTCHYWQQGNRCLADRILVTSDTMAKNMSSIIDAPMAGQVAETPVSSCTESCCKTFVPKNEYMGYEDGVIRLQKP